MQVRIFALKLLDSIFERSKKETKKIFKKKKKTGLNLNTDNHPKFKADQWSRSEYNVHFLHEKLWVAFIEARKQMEDS